MCDVALGAGIISESTCPRLGGKSRRRADTASQACRRETMYVPMYVQRYGGTYIVFSAQECESSPAGVDGVLSVDGRWIPLQTGDGLGCTLG